MVINCEHCESYIDNICFRAEEGKIHDITDEGCLLKIQIMLLREILSSLENSNEENSI